MNAHTREYPVVRLGDGNAAAHLVRTTSITDRKNASNSAIPGSLQDGLAIFIEPRIVEVCM
jgi:hypothetical protein